MKKNRFSQIALATVIAGVITAATVIGVLGQSSGGGQEGQQVKPRQEHFGRGRGHGRMGDRFSGFALRGINLTDAQKEQLKQINQNFQERTKSLRAELHAKREELRSLNSGESFNESLATQKLAETSALEAKMMGETFKLRQEIKAILTEEQKTQLEQMKSKRGGMKQRRGERNPQNN